MRFPTAACLAIAAAALTVAAPVGDAAASGRKTYEDRQRGFRLQIDEKFEQVPPKLTPDTAHIVGEWYADSAKFQGGFQRPEFHVFWFATPKKGTITPGAKDKPTTPPAAETPEEAAERLRAAARPKSVDQAMDQFFGRTGPAFGGDVPAATDLWKAGETTGTRTPKVDACIAEVNDPDDRKRDKKRNPGRAYAVAAKLTLDRPGETIEVGFLGYCGLDFVKDGKKHFRDIVKSFEDMAKIATDSRNLGAQSELDENDPEAFRRIIHQTKVIKGWSCVDTKNYVILYDSEIDPALAKKIAVQIESLREQVYEVMFPADRPVTALSVVRCCKDPSQYSAYGGPGGSAGYWNSGEKELVFYEDKGRKGDSLRVLYHEGFHQYIYYSVGDFAPHSWFNEGNGDYFFGFNYVNGKWSRDTNSWRRDLAKKSKREHRFPELLEWLGWTQAQYYGRNKSGVSIGANYALGWDFVYFLRTTKKKEYQGILDRYFATLKGCVTKAREAREAMKKAGAAPPPAPVDPDEPPVPPPPPPPGPPEGGTPTDPATPPEGGAPPAPDAPPAPAPVEPPAGPPDAPSPPPTDPPAPPVDPTPPQPETPPAPAPETPPAPATPPSDPAQPTPPAPPTTPPDAPAPPSPTPPAPDGKPPDATPPAPAPGVTFDPSLFDPKVWLQKALDEAFRGVDMRQLEKDWLAN